MNHSQHPILPRLCLILFLWLMNASLYAQAIPREFREYTNPDEIVTFDRATSFVEAIEIINQFSQEYDNRFILDKSEYSGTIGVTLPPMHWREALRYITVFRDLEVITYEEYLEIIPKRDTSVDPNAAPLLGTDGTLEGGINLGPPIPVSTRTREVRINATFFEGNRSALREIGVDWSTLTSDIPENVGNFFGDQAQENLPQTVFDDQFVSINTVGASAVTQNVFQGLINFGDVGPVNVQALFSTFEANNIGTILATPFTTVIEGQVSNIQDGQDFSIKQVDIAGNVTDRFFQTGTILTVTPWVVEENDTTFIYLEMQAERSSAQPDAVSTIITKRTATTSKLLLNGESTAIAGLYTTEETEIRRGIPFLKDLPGWFFGLKYLFGYNSKQRIERELIILVQAELVESLPDRIARSRQKKSTIIDDTRYRYRNELDLAFEGETSTPPAQENRDGSRTSSGTSSEPEVIIKTDTVYIDREVVEPESGSTEKPMESTPEDSDTTTELTDEQKAMAKELSMPVEYPELMLVVPKAFDLDQYLKLKESGVEVEENESTFFVIGGSFLVRNNAYAFNKVLQRLGYDTELLFNPRSRFYYVAYQGYTNFEASVEKLLDIRENVNDEAWLFTRESAEIEFR
ncbi:MAG: type II and III secretion system protein [Bacteroidota bacterium]